MRASGLIASWQACGSKQHVGLAGAALRSGLAAERTTMKVHMKQATTGSDPRLFGTSCAS
jgi:hypothetical protein